VYPDSKATFFASIFYLIARISHSQLSSQVRRTECSVSRFTNCSAASLRNQTAYPTAKLRPWTQKQKVFRNVGIACKTTNYIEPRQRKSDITAIFITFRINGNAKKEAVGLSKLRFYIDPTQAVW